MIENWNDVHIVPEFCDQGVDCYRLEGGSFNEYYIVSEAETRKLMNHPEVVGYEVYASLVTATSQMMYYLKEQKKITSANILSILRGALNYPLEESCYKEHIRVHDISFMSSERVFGENDEMSLDIKYCKLTMVPNSTLMIGDIIASGETLVQCLRYVTDYYRRQGRAATQHRAVHHRRHAGHRDPRKTDPRDPHLLAGLRGIHHRVLRGRVQLLRGGATRAFPASTARSSTSTGRAASSPRRSAARHFPCRTRCSKKCTIYDGGARRYEIHEHIDEVLEFWNGILERADKIDKQALLEESSATLCRSPTRTGSETATTENSMKS